MSQEQDLLNDINSEFGANTAMILDEESTLDVEVIPTGIEVVDKAIGVGGIPRGKITEVFGNEGCGKTSMCLHTIAQAQKMGLVAVFIDAEHSINHERMKALGVDTGKLIIHQPESGEMALELVEMTVRSGKVGIVVVDSVAALTPMAEIEKDMGDSVMGVHARLMSQAMRKLVAPVNINNVALMFTNQTRAKLGGFFGGETTTGGNALKFYASLRMKMQYTGQIKNSSGQRVSGKYKMTVVKSKLAIPFKEAEFEINENGIDDSGVLIDALIKAGVLEQAGSFIKFEGDVVAQGKRSVTEKLKENPELKARIVQALHKSRES